MAFVISAEADALSKLERTLLGTVILLKMPLFIIVNQIELVSKYHLRERIDELQHLIDLTVMNKSQSSLVTYDSDIANLARKTASKDVIPILPISCVSGNGFSLLNELFAEMPHSTNLSEFSTLSAYEAPQV